MDFQYYSLLDFIRCALVEMVYQANEIKRK